MRAKQAAKYMIGYSDKSKCLQTEKDGNSRFVCIYCISPPFDHAVEMRVPVRTKGLNDDGKKRQTPSPFASLLPLCR